MLDNLKDELNLTYLFIAHDLKVVKHICDRIAVMYKGKIVESGHTKQILNEPSHEYTKNLWVLYYNIENFYQIKTTSFLSINLIIS